MYLPAHFAEPDVEVLHRLIRTHPLGTLVHTGPGGLDANHLPFELDEKTGEHGLLRAHVARANPLWRELAAGGEVLVVFHGPQGYISPNWYPSKHEAHRQVPTWNYEVVHAHGRLQVRDEEAYVRGVVARLTRTHEAHIGEARPWKMGDSDPAFIQQMLANIVGIEITVTRLVGKRKLSQNKEVRDRRSAADALQARGNGALGAAMGEGLS